MQESRSLWPLTPVAALTMREVADSLAPTVTLARLRHDCFPEARKTQALVVVDPDIQSGAPVIAGTRVPIQNLFDYLEEGVSLGVFFKQFPSVPRKQAVAVLEQARAALVPDAHPA
jgi:uncharacterized protein (DUF433 family)